MRDGLFVCMFGCVCLPVSVCVFEMWELLPQPVTLSSINQ